jgi:hypothetical protein
MYELRFQGASASSDGGADGARRELGLSWRMLASAERTYDLAVGDTWPCPR